MAFTRPDAGFQEPSRLLHLTAFFYLSSKTMSEKVIKDKQTTNAEGKILMDLPEGVHVKELTNIVTRNGITTEFIRTDWGITPKGVNHAIHVVLRANTISAWHLHKLQTDYIFVLDGTIQLALYDKRAESTTYEKLCVLNLSRYKPCVVNIPPGIWHGLHNMENTKSSFVNYFDREYCYEDPDEYRLPYDANEIPYQFKR